MPATIYGVVSGYPDQSQLVVVAAGDVAVAARPGSDGMYSMMVPAGTYKVGLIDPSHGVTEQGPDHVAAGARLRVDFTAATSPIMQGARGTVRGTVVVRGAAALGTDVEVWQTDAQFTPLIRVAQTLARGDGTYSFANLQPGLYQVQAVRGGQSAAVAVALVGNDDVVVDFLLVACAQDVCSGAGGGVAGDGGAGAGGSGGSGSGGASGAAGTSGTGGAAGCTMIAGMHMVRISGTRTVDLPLTLLNADGFEPALATNVNGTLLVWNSNTNGAHIGGERLDVNGLELPNSNFIVSTLPAQLPAVAMDQNTSALVVWREQGTSNLIGQPLTYMGSYAGTAFTIASDLDSTAEPIPVVSDGSTFQVVWRNSAGDILVNTINSLGEFPDGMTGRLVATGADTYILTGSPTGSLITLFGPTGQGQGAFDLPGSDPVSSLVPLSGLSALGLSAAYGEVATDYLVLSISSTNALIGTPVNSAGSYNQVTMSGSLPAQGPTAVASGSGTYVAVYTCIEQGCPAICAAFDPVGAKDTVIFRGAGPGVRPQIVWNGSYFIVVISQ
jgi:hypothetical protein